MDSVLLPVLTMAAGYEEPSAAKGRLSGADR